MTASLGTITATKPRQARNVLTDVCYSLHSTASPVSVNLSSYRHVCKMSHATASPKLVSGVNRAFKQQAFLKPSWAARLPPREHSTCVLASERPPPWALTFDIRERETEWTDENKVSCTASQQRCAATTQRALCMTLPQLPHQTHCITAYTPSAKQLWDTGAECITLYRHITVPPSCNILEAECMSLCAGTPGQFVCWSRAGLWH